MLPQDQEALRQGHVQVLLQHEQLPEQGCQDFSSGQFRHMIKYY